MKEKSKKYLSDILIAIELLEEFIGDESDFTMYDQERKTQRDMEHQLARFGEAGLTPYYSDIIRVCQIDSIFFNYFEKIVKVEYNLADVTS